MQKVAGRSLRSRPGFAIRRLKNYLCQPSSKRVPFSNQGRIRQRKERDGLQYPRYSGTLTPLPLRLIGYWKPLALPFTCFTVVEAKELALARLCKRSARKPCVIRNSRIAGQASWVTLRVLFILDKLLCDPVV